MCTCAGGEEKRNSWKKEQRADIAGNTRGRKGQGSAGPNHNLEGYCLGNYGEKGE